MIETSIVYRDFKGKYDFFPMSRSSGSEIWDRDGKRYIDFTSAWNVTNLGWNHPEVNAALIAQAEKNTQGLLWGSDPMQEEYALALTAALPKELNACMKATGGTEAIEMSVKVARAYTGRKKVLGFEQHYHGQLFASLALGAPESARGKIAPLVPEVTPLPFPSDELSDTEYEKFLTDFEAHLSRGDVAAVVTEPNVVTGWGLTEIAHAGFLKDVRRLTEKHGTLLIVDEVGSGFSRTGTLFGIDAEGVVPDMIVFAKGISNGAAAIGTSVGRAEIFEPAFADAVLISTFGWTPVACAAALATLQVHQRDKTWEMAASKGAYTMEKLRAHLGGRAVGVRGKGLEIGLQFKDAETCSMVQKAAFLDGLHAIVGSGANMQIMPPLTIPQALLDEGLDILISHLN